MASDDYFIADSVPLEVYKLSRSSRSRICKEDYQTAPDKGCLNIDYQQGLSISH